MNLNNDIISLDLIEGGRVIRQGDHFSIAVVPRDAKGAPVNLSGKTIEVDLLDRKGIVYETTGEYDASKEAVRFSINENIGFGEMRMEFTATDPEDSTYRRKFPASDYDGRLQINRSGDDVGYIGVRMVTVEQLRQEQQDAQAKYETRVNAKVQQIETGFTEYKQETDGFLEGIQQEAEEVIAEEFATFKQSNVKDKEFPTVDDRFEELEEDSYFPAINLIENGNFSEGATDWDAVNGDLSINQNIASVTGTGSRNDIQILRKNPDALLSAEHKYYIRTVIDLNAESGTTYITLWSSMLSYTNIMIANIRKDQQTKSSVVFIPPETLNYSFRIRSVFSNNESTIGKTLSISSSALIDLTSTFGAGNEPSVEEMDVLLAQFPNSWFDGTEQLGSVKQLMIRTMQELRKKANKQQEEWIAPTFVSGATGNIQYRKNAFGGTEFKGVFTPALSNVNVIYLASDYMPVQEITILVPFRDWSGSVYMTFAGAAVFISGLPNNPIGKEISLNAVQFPK